MAATPLAVTTITRDGVADALSAANADGHTVVNTGKMWVEIANDGVADITVSFAITATVDGQSVDPRQEVIPDGERQAFGPFPVSFYSDSLGITFTDVTDVTIGAFKV